MRYVKTIEGTELACVCSEDLATQASLLLDKLEELHRAGPALRAGSKIRFGWSCLTLLADGAGLLVAEPNFDADPLADVSPTVDRSLRVQAQQAAVCALAGAVGPDVTFDQTLVVERGSLEQSIVYLRRNATSFLEFSGWYIGSAPGVETRADPDRFDIVPVYRLLALRPALLDALQLPTGHTVVFDGPQLLCVFAADGTLLYGSSDAS